MKTSSLCTRGGVLAAAASLLLVHPEHALADLTYDLRVTGGGKIATVSSLGQVVRLELYAEVTGTDPTKPEGFQDGYGSVMSSAGQNIMGSISSSLVSTFAGIAYQPGTSQDLDGDGDLDLGSNSSVSNTDFIFMRAGTVQTSGDPIANGTEFHLASFFFTVQSVNNFLDPTPINVNFSVPTFTRGIDIEALWQQDNSGTNSNGLNGGTIPSVGAAVMIRAIPEPSSAGLLGLAGVALAARRRSRK